MSARRIAIVGGGFSGTTAAVQCAARGLDPVLIERAPRVGRGVAYSTERPEHLLNVRASAMSAFPDRPSDFTEACGGDGSEFAPRMRYGEYLDRILREAERPVRVLRDEAVAVEQGERESVQLASGETIEADVVILALGNFPPAPMPALSGLPPELVAENPWSADFAAGLSSAQTVVLIGTGLTAVDAILTLDACGYEGAILALSRRGLAPRAHGKPAPVPPPPEAKPPRCTELLRAVRADAEEMDWHAAIDRLRPVTQQLWRSADLAERRRFLRHLRPWWDVHRHRIAPEVAERLDRLQGEGRLTFAAGKLVGVEATDGGASLSWRPRGSDGVETIEAARIVNCTGPELDIRRSFDPLLRSLVAAGRIRPDACAMGIDVNADCSTLAADGSASGSLFAVGPMTRGTFWESVAVPDIRVQVAVLAERLRLRS